MTTTKSHMNTNARMTFLRAFGWFLCMLLTLSGGVVAEDVAERAAENPVLASDAVASSESSSDGFTSDADASDASDCSADLEPFEELAIFGLRIAFDPPRIFDLSFHHLGRPPSNYSSPEPRPAERV
jgi:hypothetical protein